ncbi:hypothetical protein [Acidithiobacillus sulfurivorans]|uniref:Lipoprotein n=1 Tax=Acidithiobacillus sulfurivorans TaxID=1958756 RepID=A0ABS5ZX91_9PROT|nr:hypothetical protein [Acidithiobacillus sulfurivorans]MBU2759526.1 hypothetical protein [Acidithiobacillus sulfurivorans]
MKIGKLVLLVTVVLVLAGCGMGWTRPDTLRPEAERDILSCKQEALKLYPIDMVTTAVGSGYQNPAQTYCNTYGQETDCTTYSGNYVPPATTTQDINLNSRNIAFSECMESLGYKWKW